MFAGSRPLARSRKEARDPFFEVVPIVTKFIVGLGNPGPTYEKTRHNLGFLAVDAYAKAAGFGRARKRFQALCREKQVGDPSVMLVKPLTYMNLSGTSIRDLLAFHRVIGGRGDLPPPSVPPRGTVISPPRSPPGDGSSCSRSSSVRAYIGQMMSVAAELGRPAGRAATDVHSEDGLGQQLQ